MSEERHEFWAPIVESDEHVFGSDELRSRFFIIAGLTITCLIALVVGLGVLAQRGMAPPMFVGYSHGLFFTGKNEPVSAIDFDADLRQQFADTVEVLFLRTEKGTLPALDKFVDKAVLDQMEAGYKQDQVRIKPGFAQTFTILEHRNAPSPGAPVRRSHMMGVLSSRGLDGSQSSTIYLQCDFAPKEGSAENSTGWRLTAISRLREDQFFSEERERERIRLLGLDAPDRPAPPPSPNK